MNPLGLPKTRDEAKAQGAKTYFTGEPCKRGHLDVRVTANGGCRCCGVEASRRWQSKNIERVRVVFSAWAEDNREARAAQRRARHAAAPEKRRSYANEYRRRNLDKLKAQRKAWEGRNVELMNAHREKYRRENPEAVLAVIRARRARKKNAPGRHTAADVERIMIAQNALCAVCSVNLFEVKYHVDHKTPLSRGGSNGPENLQILCATCNCQKGALTVEEFARKRDKS